MSFFLCLIGMIMLIEGLVLFAFPQQLKRTMLQILSVKDTYLKRFGFIIMFLGFLIVYFAKIYLV